MKIFFLILLILVAAATVALWFWRQADQSADHAAMARLAALQPDSPERFDLSLIEGLPELARTGGDPDHTRSAFGRYVAEAVFWTPAALLPGPGVAWKLVDVNAARVIVRHEGMEQAVDIVVAEDGRPLQVSFDRWSNANPEKVHRLQPFGGYLSEFREFEGFVLPTRVEAGNFFATDDYFPFFLADVKEVKFLKGYSKGHPE